MLVSSPVTRLIYWLLPLLLIACTPSQEDFIAELKQKAENGEAQAQYQVGLLHYNGHSVPQDTTLAIDWFSRAAEQNYGEAQFNLGILYERGDGAPQDYVQAFYWYMLAAQNKIDFAPQALNDLAVNLTLEQQDDVLNRVKDFNQAHGIDFKVKTELTAPPPAPVEATEIESATTTSDAPAEVLEPTTEPSPEAHLTPESPTEKAE